jgi:hypothetical protein
MEGLECDRSTGPSVEAGSIQVMVWIRSYCSAQIWEDLLTTEIVEARILSHTKHNLVALIRF